jgi:hypothetical protein
MKTCSKCGLDKPKEEFNKVKDRRRPECKVCENDLRSARMVKQKKVNPDSRQAVVLKNKFGLDFDVYKLMLEAQGNACAICGSRDPGWKKRYFSVDHCHKTGRIRGLLCHSCNAGLGMFKDQPNLLLAASTYLQEQF